MTLDSAFASALRLAVAVVIIVLLARVVPVAWANRRLAIDVWRRIRLRHIAGSLVLIVIVLTVAVALMEFLPLTGYGLGSLIGLTGNAVFAPVEEAAARGGAAAGAPSDTVNTLVTLGSVAFLAGLLVMFPWLAYVEERVFREGLELASPRRHAWTALRFGLVHLVMLVPLAAALAIAVAGLWYGQVYLRAYRREAAHDPLRADRARAAAVLESTVWHVSFNSTLVVLTTVGLLLGAVSF